MLLRFDVSVFSILASAARQTARGSISTMSGRLPGEIPRRRPSSDSAMFGRRVARLYTEHALPRARLVISNLSRWPGNRRVESSATRMKPRLHAAPHGAGVPRSSDRRWLRATHLETNPCRVPRRSGTADAGMCRLNGSRIGCAARSRMTGPGDGSGDAGNRIVRPRGRSRRRVSGRAVARRKASGTGSPTLADSTSAAASASRLRRRLRVVAAMVKRVGPEPRLGLRQDVGAVEVRGDHSVPKLRPALLLVYLRILDANSSFERFNDYPARRRFGRGLREETRWLDGAPSTD